jgi:hypothetical protein
MDIKSPEQILRECVEQIVAEEISNDEMLIEFIGLKKSEKWADLTRQMRGEPDPNSDGEFGPSQEDLRGNPSLGIGMPRTTAGFRLREYLIEWIKEKQRHGKVLSVKQRATVNKYCIKRWSGLLKKANNNPLAAKKRLFDLLNVNFRSL